MHMPKFGDRCEFAVFDSKTMKNMRTCPVRHFAGKPPGQLVVRVQDKQSVLVCTRHSKVLSAPSVQKQKAGQVNAEQMDLLVGDP